MKAAELGREGARSLLERGTPFCSLREATKRFCEKTQRTKRCCCPLESSAGRSEVPSARAGSPLGSGVAPHPSSELIRSRRLSQGIGNLYAVCQPRSSPRSLCRGLNYLVLTLKQSCLPWALLLTAHPRAGRVGRRLLSEVGAGEPVVPSV